MLNFENVKNNLLASAVSFGVLTILQKALANMPNLDTKKQSIVYILLGSLMPELSKNEKTKKMLNDVGLNVVFTGVSMIAPELIPATAPATAPATVPATVNGSMFNQGFPSFENYVNGVMTGENPFSTNGMINGVMTGENPFSTNGMINGVNCAVDTKTEYLADMLGNPILPTVEVVEKTAVSDFAKYCE